MFAEVLEIKTRQELCPVRTVVLNPWGDFDLQEGHLAMSGDVSVVTTEEDGDAGIQ